MKKRELTRVFWREPQFIRQIPDRAYWGFIEGVLFCTELPEAVCEGAKVLETLRLLPDFHFKSTATALQLFFP